MLDRLKGLGQKVGLIKKDGYSGPLVSAQDHEQYLAKQKADAEKAREEAQKRTERIDEVRKDCFGDPPLKFSSATPEQVSWVIRAADLWNTKVIKASYIFNIDRQCTLEKFEKIHNLDVDVKGAQLICDRDDNTRDKPRPLKGAFVALKGKIGDEKMYIKQEVEGDFMVRVFSKEDLGYRVD